MSDSDTKPIDLTRPEWRDDPALLKAELEARLPSGIVIDAATSRPVDTLTAQLLLAARRASLAAGNGFSINHASDPFRQGLRVLALHDEILGEREAK